MNVSLLLRFKHFSTNKKANSCKICSLNDNGFIIYRCAFGKRSNERMNFSKNFKMNKWMFVVRKKLVKLFMFRFKSPAKFIDVKWCYWVQIKVFMILTSFTENYHNYYTIFRDNFGKFCLFLALKNQDYFPACTSLLAWAEPGTWQNLYKIYSALGIIC